MDARHLLHGGGSLLRLLALLIDAAMNLIGCRAHGCSVAGERACSVSDGADDTAKAALHLLHGCSQSAYLILAVEMVEFFTGKVSSGDGIRALGDEIDGFRDAASKHDRDNSANKCAENRRNPERVERRRVGMLQLRYFVVSLGHLRLTEVACHGKERLFERKDLILESIVGLCCALRCLGFVELLDLVFKRFQVGESCVEIVDAGGIIAKAVA